VPIAVAVWDEWLCISGGKKIPNCLNRPFQKLQGFKKESGTNGILIYKANGWDYPASVNIFGRYTTLSNGTYPGFVHIDEIPQPQAIHFRIA